MTTRIDRRFARLKEENRPALVTYFMGGDPDYDTALSIMKALPAAGSDSKSGRLSPVPSRPGPRPSGS